MIETRWIKGDEAEAAYTSLQCPWAAASSLRPNHRDLLERDVYKVHITFIEWGFWPIRGWSIRLCTWCVCVQIPNVKHCKRWYKCLVNLLWWKCKIKLCYSGFARSSENPISFLQKVRKEEKLPVAAGTFWVQSSWTPFAARDFSALAALCFLTALHQIALARFLSLGLVSKPQNTGTECN